MNLSFNTLDSVNNSTSTVYHILHEFTKILYFFHWVCVLDQRDLVLVSILTSNTLVFEKLFELLTNYILFGLCF